MGKYNQSDLNDLAKKLEDTANRLKNNELSDEEINMIAGGKSATCCGSVCTSDSNDCASVFWYMNGDAAACLRTCIFSSPQ